MFDMMLPPRAMAAILASLAAAPAAAGTHTGNGRTADRLAAVETAMETDDCGCGDYRVIEDKTRTH